MNRIRSGRHVIAIFHNSCSVLSTTIIRGGQIWEYWSQKILKFTEKMKQLYPIKIIITITKFNKL